MKPLAPYFGNRFASVTKKKAIKSAAKTKATSEMETLESRILLSGVGTGLNKKNVSFFDADGDKVTVSLQGKGSFNIDLGGNTNNSDIANISINGVLNKTTLAVEAGSLGVVVTPAGSFTKPVQTKVIYNPNGIAGAITTVGDVGNGGISQKIATQFYDLTPGFTNIGSITTATNVTSVGSIGLNAAIVPVIDLGSAAAGNINLSTGMVAKVDQLMTTNKSFQPERPIWTANLGKIDLFDISAGSIAGINISSVGTDNDFNGDVVATTGGIGRITGTNADFNGTISLLGATSGLGNIVVASFSDSAVITAAGNLTFNAAGYGGLIDVTGHLNLSLIGNSEFTGTIIADGGISGLNASLTDTILVNGVDIGTDPAGTDLSAQIITSGDMAPIIINNATLYGALDAKNIGTIHFGANSALVGAVILASEDLGGLVTRDAGLDLSAATIVVGDTVGLIDVAGGDLSGSITAANFTKITVRGGLMDADILGTSSIGDVTVTDGSITGSLIAQGAAGIGNIKAVSFADATNDGGAIIGATIYSAGGIASITATTTDTNSPAIGETNAGVDTNISALGTVGAITATSFGADGTAIEGLTFVAPSISGVTANAPFGVAVAGTNTFISTTGSIGNITATGLDGGILGATTLNSATTVGSISGTALSGTNAGISGLTINAQTGISTVTGKAFGGDGIGGVSKFYSLTGNISAISGSSTSMSDTGDGIDGLEINAIAGSVADITGSSSGITGGHGLNGLNVDALTGIGTITGTAIGGNGINGGTYDVTGDGANITAIVAKTSTGTAINGGDFTAIGGTISAITATPTGAAGNAINGADFTAEFLGDISVTVSNLDGGFAINNSTFTAINGDIGKITVVNNSLGVNNAAFGIGAGVGGTTSFKATGSIGIIDVTVAANGDNTTAAIQGNVDFIADSDNDQTGSIASVDVTTSGSNGIQGIGDVAGSGVALFQAQNITGDFVVTMNGKGAGSAIDGDTADLAQPSVIDLAGNMGKLTVDNNSLLGTANGLEDVKIDVAGTMGAITITTAGGSGMVRSAIDPTTIASIDISVESTAGGAEVAIDANSEIIATVSIGDVNIVDDVAGDITVADIGGGATSIGKVTITGDFIAGGAITAGTTIGVINITGDSAGTILSGQDGDATTGTITSLTVGGDLTGNVTAALGNIGAVTVTGDVTSKIEATEGSIAKVDISGDMTNVGTSLKAGTTIAEIIVDGDLTGDIQSGTAVGATTGTITSLTVGGDLSGDVTASVGNIGAVEVTGDFTSTIEATKGNVAASSFGTVNGAAEIIAGSAGNAGTIGNITITGNNGDGSNQEIALNAFKATTGGTIGTITATSLEDTTSLEVTVGANAVSLDDIEVAAADADTANLVLSTGGLLATLGDIDSDGNANLAAVNTAVTTLGTVNVVGAFTMAAANLDNLTSVGDFTVGSVSAAAAAQFGAGAASSVGYITIGSNQNAGAAANITFTFNSWDGISAASATDVVTVNTTDSSYNDIVAGNPLVDGELEFQDV